MPIGLIAGLGVNDELLDAVHGDKARGAPCALGDGLIQLPTHAVAQCESRSGFPGVLKVCSEVIAADGGGTDVRAVREVRRREMDRRG